MIDALLWIRDRYPDRLPKVAEDVLERGRRFILVTVHRRKSLAFHIEGIMQAFKALVEIYPEVEIIYPVHLNPKVQEAAVSVLGGAERVHLIPPIFYPWRRPHLQEDQLGS